MPTIRCVLCAAKQPLDTVFQFPRHTLSQRKWMKICNVEEVRPSMGVCVRHFERNEINLGSKVPRLSPGAVPTLHTSSEPFEGRVTGTINAAKKISQLQPLKETRNPRKYLLEDIPEATRNITLPEATYARLQAVKTAMKASSLETTVDRLATWFLRKESRIKLGQGPEQLSEWPADAAPGAEREPAAAHPLRALVSDGPPLDDGRDLTEAQLLQEMDVQLESEDDPAAENGSTDALFDGGPSSAHWGVASAIISEPQLQQLLLETPTRCLGCMQLVPPAINRISLSYSVTWVCPACGVWARPPWHSTSGSGQVATFDTVFAAAVTLSGCSLAGVQRLLAFVNLGRLNGAAFHRLTDAVVSPVLGEQFRDALEAGRQAALDASPDGLVVAGSYQVDSPDFSTSFGTYTVMDHQTGHIVAQSTVAHQGPRSPSRREQLEAVRRCLADLRRAEVPVKEFVSDRHVGVKKLVGKALRGAKYSYDVWDAARHVEKRISALAAKSGHEKLKSWVEYLKNHFWWCAKAADGDPEAFRRLWVTAADHVASDGRDEGRHGALSGAGAERDRLAPDSAEHRALRQLVLDGRTLRLADHVVRNRHESRLEVFRAVDRQYTPKQEPCTYNRLVARKQAAVLEFGAHLSRPYAQNRDGSVRHIRAYSRGSGRYLTRPVRAAKTYAHVGPLLARMAELRQRTTISEPTVLGSAG